jgi:hypothetical protein
VGVSAAPVAVAAVSEGDGVASPESVVEGLGLGVPVAQGSGVPVPVPVGVGLGEGVTVSVGVGLAESVGHCGVVGVAVGVSPGPGVPVAGGVVVGPATGVLSDGTGEGPMGGTECEGLPGVAPPTVTVPPGRPLPGVPGADGAGDAPASSGPAGAGLGAMTGPGAPPRSGTLTAPPCRKCSYHALTRARYSWEWL